MQPGRAVSAANPKKNLQIRGSLSRTASSAPIAIVKPRSPPAPSCTEPSGISALQLQKQLGIGSCRSAWMLAAKLRRAMVAPERSPLSSLVEIDEASLPQRQGRDRDRQEDGWSGCSALPRERHRPHVIGDRPAHEILAWIHTALCNLKGWAWASATPE